MVGLLHSKWTAWRMNAAHWQPDLLNLRLNKRVAVLKLDQTVLGGGQMQLLDRNCWCLSFRVIVVLV